MPNPPEEWWLDDALAKEMGLDTDAIEGEHRSCLLLVAEGGQATLSSSLVSTPAAAPGAGKIKICFDL